MAEICDNFAVSRAVSGIGLQFAINHIERPKGRADRRLDEGTGKTPGADAQNINIIKDKLTKWRIKLWYLAEEHSKIGCPHFSMTFSMMTSGISAT